MSEKKLTLNRGRGKSLLPWFIRRNPEVAEKLNIKLITKEDLSNKKLNGKAS